MRTLRILVAALTLLAGLALASRADAALSFFTETAPASADYTGTGAKPLVGDFTGDGRSDVFFYRSGTGAEVFKVGKSNHTFATVTAGITVSGVFQPLVGDFDGNGVTDIFWYAPGVTADRLWLFQPGGTHISVAETVNGTFKPLVGDFMNKDGDNRDDIFWYAPGTAADSLWKATGAGHFLPVPKTVDGTYAPFTGYFTPDPSVGGSTDGTLDIFWYGNTTGSPDRLWKGNGNGGFTSVAYSAPDAARPVVGFFDGYGVQDILWNRPGSTDSVWLADPDLGTFTAHPANVVGDVRAIVGPFLIPDEPIVFWSATGGDTMWFPQGEPGVWDYYAFYNNTDMGAGFQPVTGDFDGDHHADLYWIKPGVGRDLVWFGPG